MRKLGNAEFRIMNEELIDFTAWRKKRIVHCNSCLAGSGSARFAFYHVSI